MKANTILAVIISCFLTFPAYGYSERNLLQKEADVLRLKECIIMDRKWVPYPGYNDRQGWSKVFGEQSDIYIQRGVSRLNYQWKVVKATDYIEFEKSGSRKTMEDPFNSNNTAITDLFIAELAEGKGRFIPQLINGVFMSCEMTSWVLSAHLGRQKSKRSLPDYKEQIIDLTSADMSSLFAWVYYFMKEEFDKVNPVIAERLRSELQNRMLDPYLNNDSFWWLALNAKAGTLVNNWNPWCNFNALQCFALLEDDPEVLVKAVFRSMVSVDKFINYTHEDGACEEGCSYWGHAAGKMYDYLQVLYDVTGGKVSIFQNPMIRNMGEFISRSYVGNGWVVNFADASAKYSSHEAPLIFRYGKACGSDEMMSFAAYLAKGRVPLQTGRDIFRILQTLQYQDELINTTPALPPAPYTWYPETEFCYIKEPGGFMLATKGGFNNESHNHNDVGTFSLYYDDEPVFIDVGVGTYVRQTFSSERYTIWTMQSDYHNVPKINGFSQSAGSKYKAENVKFSHKKKEFLADIAGAYPDNAGVKYWNRTYALGKRKLQIKDAYELDTLIKENEMHFLLWKEPDISQPGTAKIATENSEEIITLSYDASMFEVSKEVINLDDSRLSVVWGKNLYRLILKAREMKQKGNYNFIIQSIKK